ncbi:Exostosin domain-containing protein [Psidium guajava]|nr:Exostosin domain-containing protein [Psidium guajava]
MESHRGIAVARAVLCSACLVSAALVLLSWSFDFGGLARFAPDPSELKSGSPMVRQLAMRKKATSSNDLVRAASFASAESALGVQSSPRRNKTTIVSFSG